MVPEYHNPNVVIWILAAIFVTAFVGFLFIEFGN